MGPGFITGSADDDPSGIVTYTQTGSIFGLKQLWTAPFSFPFMYAIQEMCGRIGLITGKGLAGVIKKYYGSKLLYPTVLLLFIANIVNISTDLGAMAASLQLVFGQSFYLWLILAAVTTLLLEVFISYKNYFKYLKFLAFSLLFYAVCIFFINLDFKEIIISTFIPKIIFSKNYILNFAAILGTTISPYLFFWQSYEEVEQEVEKGKLRSLGAGIPKVTRSDMQNFKRDTLVGMFFSNLIMWFIILVAGSTLFKSQIYEISSAGDAALALAPIAGDWAFILFFLGIVSTGLLAIPILAGSVSYAFSEVFGLKAGLYRKLKEAHGFYGAIAVAILLGFLINFLKIPVMKALYYTAILNGAVAPPLIFIILAISNNKRIMGGNVNSKLSNVLGLTIGIIMSAISVLLILSLLKIV